MGRAKALMMEQDEQGWAFSDHMICPECICDESLKERILLESMRGKCTFCGKSDEGCARFDSLMGLIAPTLFQYFTRAAGEAIWDSESREYLGDTFDTEDLIHDRLDPVSEDDDVVAAIVQSLGPEVWCPRNMFALEGVELFQLSWQHFCETVKHRTRYFFESAEDAHGYRGAMHAATMLDDLGSIVRSLESDLVTVLPPGTSLFRFRRHTSKRVKPTWSELGSPPTDKAVSSRMSPVGISMFYAAFEKEVAWAETASVKPVDGIRLTGASWTSQEHLRVLDLTALPTKIPSMFAMRRDTREGLVFLRDFVRDITMPVVFDGKERIEYVPAQITTEFFRRESRRHALGKLDGIVYPSSKVRSGRCVVVFLSHDDLDPEQGGRESTPLLGLDPHSIVRLPAGRS